MRKIDEQLDLLRRGKISRREFLSTALALGVALPTATASAGTAVIASIIATTTRVLRLRAMRVMERS